MDMVTLMNGAHFTAQQGDEVMDVDISMHTLYMGTTKGM
jgi:hypothetical protein